MSRTSVARLAAHLLDGVPDAISEEISAWLTGSPRFRAFADANRDKIRKKLRTAADPEALLDVRAELRVAHLLADGRLELAFEAYGSGRRGPDFTVTHRGLRPFNLEVTRLRATTSPEGVLVAKLRQLPPSVPNVLLFAVSGAEDGVAVDPGGTAASLRARADDRDDAFFAGRGLDGARDFHARFLRLGALVAWSETACDADRRVASWTNRSARIAVPDRALRACLDALRA